VGFNQRCSLAAWGGHIEVVRWAREHGCPWDRWTTDNAARGGHLEVLRWAQERDCPWNESECELDSKGHARDCGMGAAATRAGRAPLSRDAEIHTQSIRFIHTPSYPEDFGLDLLCGAGGAGVARH